MRPLPLVLNALAATTALAIAVAGPPRAPEREPAFDLVAAGGALTLSNSQAGVAILRGEGLRPGGEVTGTVTVGADRDADLTLAGSLTDDAAGAGGGRLSGLLQLVVSDVTAPAQPVDVYAGPLATLDRVELGAVAAGAARTYRFAVRLPQATGDEHQGARLAADFTWTARAPEPAPDRGTVPAPDPGTSPAPAPDGRAAGPGEVLAAPTVRGCVPGRRVRIRLRVGRGVRVRSVRVRVNGRRGHVKRRRGTLVVRRLPRRAVKIKVVARLSDGRRLVVKRTYAACDRRRKA